MSNRKILMALFAAAGMFGTNSASADVGTAQVTKLLGSSVQDLAPVTNSSPARLRRRRNEQPGAEQPAVAMFSDNIHGIYFERRSGTINGQLPQNRVQGAMVPFSLVQDQATGAVKVQPDLTNAKFITTHRGSEDRNFNQPFAFAANGGSIVVVAYNYRPNNRTYQYFQAYNMAGQQVMPETKVMAKNNDDCAMSMDGLPGVVAQVLPAGNGAGSISHYVYWAGCNGNGQDDGWLNVVDIQCDSATSPTSCTAKKQFDVSLAQREERSRGTCSVGTDPNTAICSWTEGNTQPQRDGVWLAAVDITPGTTGNDRQEKILWKQMVDGRKDATDDGTPRTYAMRAMSERIMMPDATTGQLKPTDMIIWRSADVHGNNRNNRKGGTYYRTNMAVMKVTAAGMEYVVPMTNMQETLRGIEGTHLGVSYGLFGTTDAPIPGIIFESGSQNGGGAGAQVAAVGYDTASKGFKVLGNYTVASMDRHMYPNYLGQNPGNQGRNFSATMMIQNPFCTAGAACDKYLALFATTGKDSAEVATRQADGTYNDMCYAADDTAKTNAVPCARLKLSSYLTVLPIASQPAPAAGTGSDTGTGMGSDQGSSAGSDQGSGVDQPAATDPGTTLGGCSATGGAGGAMTFLLIGLAAFLRRRD